MQTNREILAKLKFISKIQPSEKLSLSDMKVCIDDVFTMIWRTIFRDSNRNRTLSFLQDTIDKAFEIIQNYRKSDKKSDLIIVQNIIFDLSKCKQGLHNLRETYKSDRKFCCDIDILQVSIDARLTEVDPYLLSSSIFPPPPTFDSDEKEDYFPPV